MAVTNTAADGRTARGLRTRRAIVDALLSLVQDGDLAPTAPRIAARAGVSVRSIYQHFADLEALFGAASDRAVDRIVQMARPLPGVGPLDARVDEFVEQRSRILEALTPVRRAALLQEPHSPTLRATRERLLGLARSEIAHVFGPELRAVPAGDRRELLAALDVAAGWPAWDALRTGGLSEAAARRVVARTLRALARAQPPDQEDTDG